MSPAPDAPTPAPSISSETRLSSLVAVLRAILSLISVALVGLAWLVLALPLRLVVVPGSWLFPRYRPRLISLYVKVLSWATFTLLRVGGGRFRRRGVLPTGSPIYVVANHQALLDTMQAALLGQPYAPAFVTRYRYARFIPQVSVCIRLLGGPLVALDVRKSPGGSIDALRRAARELTHALLIYPEGHRTKTGEVGRFRGAGFEAMLRERRLPVYVIINDGLWRAPRFADGVLRVHLMDGWSEVVGKFEPPEKDSDLPAFIDHLRGVIVERLAAHRAEPES